MSNLLTINVKNNEATTLNFFFFQQPATFSGGPVVHSNSLYTQPLGNYGQTGAILTFQVTRQNYAGIQEAHSTPSVGQSSGYASASRPIELASASGSADDGTTASVSPSLGLSRPSSVPGVQHGAFRIETPSFMSPPFYNIGTASEVNGGIVLSSFIQAIPNANTDVMPVEKFYVSTGDVVPGSVVDFSMASIDAAMCDFTKGYSTIDVDLQPDGTWSATNIS